LGPWVQRGKKVSVRVPQCPAGVWLSIKGKGKEQNFGRGEGGKGGI